MQQFFLILTGMAIGAILLVVCKLLLNFRQVLTAKVLSLLLLSSAFFMLMPWVQGIPLVEFFLVVGAMTNPAFFWMFASTLFQMGEDKEKLHIGHYIALAVCVCIGAFQYFIYSMGLETSIIRPVALFVASSLTVLGLVDIFRSWQSDLVEWRRLFRLVLSVAAGAFLLFTVVIAFIYGHREFPIFLNYLNIVVICAFAMVFGYITLVSDSKIVKETLAEYSPEIVKDKVAQPSFVDSQWLEQLNHSMENAFYYRQVDLTIKILSEHLSIPEHQLRRLINQHLGYKNFNDYLNRYRVRDAAQRLADPKLARIPILTIAIEAGYGSLTTFNKAFKAIKNMTPSEFRKLDGLVETE
ncbi:helix-turn-helix domain-containing protein [uncultured Paraglaciecola sp.]|uniref:AraC family transcriptional regulator n=1 Tax=uncultured Paraglaciecola sp. TaxID=1765024 RepID=UPI0026358F56|nr:helix-turn-helix domain-containing protein [uncultured Paraglaciecola sp.]